MKSVEFTYLVGGKKLTIRDPRTVGAIIHGEAVMGKDGSGGTVTAVFLVIDKCPSPLGVTESYEEVKAKLDSLINNN